MMYWEYGIDSARFESMGTFQNIQNGRLLPPAIAVLVCFLPFVPPAAALGAGIAVGAIFGTRAFAVPEKTDRYLLQGSVVLLGFGMDVRVVLRESVNGIWLSAVLLAMTFLVGALSARFLRVERQASLLVSAGTAICGGSAIASVAASTRADRESIGMSMAVVFLLNAASLVLFPVLGHVLGMDARTFGTWAGLAIHDLSSVVGAATSFDPSALPAAIAVKLGRTLWILPVSMLAAWIVRFDGEPRKFKAPVPVFLLGFAVAALIGMWEPSLQAWMPAVRMVSHGGFDLALIVIGTRFDFGRIRRGGPGLLVQGLVQWILVALVSWAWIEGT